MASKSGAIRAGRAFVELFGDDSKLVRVLNQASKKVKAFGLGIMAIGGKLMAGGMALAAPLIASIRIFSDWGSNLNDMSARIGVSVEALSELGHAAKMSGTDLETVEGAIKKMQKALSGIGGPTKDAAEALGALGLSVDVIRYLSPEDQFQAISEQLDGISDPGRKAAIAMALFGKSGTMLLPMMNDLKKTREEAKRLGQTMTTTDATAADSLGDALDTLWGSIRGVSSQIGVALAPMVTQLASAATELVIDVIEWVKANKDLIVTFGKISAWIFGIGAVVTGLGAAIYSVGIAFGILSYVAMTFGSIITGSVAVLGAVWAAITALSAPLALLIAGLAGVAAYFIATGDAGSWVGSILSWLGDSFGWLKDTALKAWNAITGAIASGDIGAAMNVAWATIKMVWTSGIGWLQQKWAAFKGWFLQVWNEAVYGTALLMTGAWAAMQRIWVSAIAGLRTAWIGFTAFVGNTWNNMQSMAGNAMFSMISGVQGGISSIAKGLQGLNGEITIGGVPLSKFLDPLGLTGIDTGKEGTTKRNAMLQGVIDAMEGGKQVTADAQRIMDESLQNQKTARDKESSAQRKQIEDDVAAQKAAINKKQQVNEDALTADMMAADKIRNAQIDKDIAAAKAAADAAKAEWDKAVGLAGNEAAMPSGPGKPKPFAGADVSGQMKSNVVSTFNAFALSGLGTGGNAQEETARNTRETARVLKRFEWQGIPSSVKAT